MTDNELLLLLQQKPEKGLEAIVRQYSAYVMKIVSTRLSDVCTKEDMEEAVSDIFLLFYQSSRKEGFVCRSLRGFLSVVAARHCISVFRQKCRHPAAIPLDEIAEPACPPPMAETGLHEALAKLDGTDRALIIRRYFFGQRSKEIAAEMQMKPNTVDKRLSRALVRLRRLMEEDDQ
ncbi:MAG: hypothetical protein IJN11_02985 [Oscillospiraceae bacterium]|nr:hypothetical protein [Oscillospiraceae bacterium]